MFYFSDALNTFYLRLYSVGHRVKVHSHSEKGYPLPLLHGHCFGLAARGLTDRIVHITAFVVPVVEYWLEGEMTEWEFRLQSQIRVRVIQITVGRRTNTVSESFRFFSFFINIFPMLK